MIISYECSIFPTLKMIEDNKKSEEPIKEDHDICEKCHLCEKEPGIANITIYYFSTDHKSSAAIICNNCNNKFMIMMNARSNNFSIIIQCVYCGNEKTHKWIIDERKIHSDGEVYNTKSIYCSVLCKNKDRRNVPWICGNCDARINPSHKLMCDACKYMYYCSVKCQKENWSDHKKECKQICMERKYNPDSEEAKYTCCLCFKRSIKEMNHCAACKKYRYCSAKCQKKDWPAHKKICVKTGD